MRTTFRSRFLVHWTGKDIDKSDATVEGKADSYIARLRATLRSGLWMMPPPEKVAGRFPYIRYNIPMTCFTEVLLSRVRDHTERYGHLGFAFTRKWLLDQGGSPVLYIRNHAEDRVAQRVFGVLARVETTADVVLDVLDGTRIDELRGLYGQLASAVDLLRQHMALLKPMSNYGQDDFEFFEEAEWRILHDEDWYEKLKRVKPATPFGIDALALMEQWKRSPNIVSSGTDRPRFYFTFQADDLALLIVPDERTRSGLWDDTDIRKWLCKRHSHLPILTLEECEGF
jgi:hypothetical protein